MILVVVLNYAISGSSSMYFQLLEERERECLIYRNEEENRERINRLYHEIRPVQLLPTDPIDDSHRVSALLMIAQRRLAERMRISNDLHRVIHQYADYNEIRTLYRMFPLLRDRMRIFGFESYEAMHRRYQTRASKISYIQSLRRRSRTQEVVEVTFDQNQRFIKTLKIRRVALPFADNHHLAFNWDAVAELAHLTYLQLSGLGIEVSMNDIRNLPDSLKILEIRANYWMSKTAQGDVDLSLLPRELESFSASGCRGLNGTLKLDAPDSKVVSLAFSDTDLRMGVDCIIDLPPSLKRIFAPPTVDASTVQLLEENGVRVI